MATVDTVALLNARIGKALSTVIPPVPTGTWPGRLGEPEIVEIVSKNDGRTFYKLQMLVEVDSDEVRQATGKDKPTTRFECFLDLNPDGTLCTEEHHNIDLGRVLESYNMNDGKASIAELEGRDCYVTVRNRPDNRDPNIIRDYAVKIEALR